LNNPLKVEAGVGPDEYLILNGQHRFLAAKKLGIKELGCNIYKNITAIQRQFLAANSELHYSDDFYVRAFRYNQWVIYILILAPRNASQGIHVK
jgi:hypothetical protein